MLTLSEKWRAADTAKLQLQADLEASQLENSRLRSRLVCACNRIVSSLRGRARPSRSWMKHIQIYVLVRRQSHAKRSFRVITLFSLTGVLDYCTI